MYMIFRKKKIVSLLIITAMCMTLLSACGKKTDKITYEIVDGQIVEIVPDGYQGDTDASGQSASSVSPTPQQIISTAEPTREPSGNTNDVVSYSPNGEIDNYIAPSDTSPTADSIPSSTEAVQEEYNSISSESSERISALERDFENAVNACHDIYESADKGQGINVTLSSATIAELITAVGNAGYPAIDSNNDFNMQCHDAMHQFGLSVRTDTDTQGTYFVIYSDGHMSAFQLYRQSGKWHLLAMSSEIGQFKIYEGSKGRYSVDSVEYTDNGWLIYLRSGNTKYEMVRVRQTDSYARQLCARYIEPVGYLENNLFTTTWSETNIGPVDFNSLYAYLFGMYNGTDMLSSYNVRNYYKAYGGTRIYIVPTGTFESVVQTYFNVDSSVLKSISDYSGSLGGYMFLGYNRDYYNVTPKTPFPDVIAYESNNNGSITLTVNAVNAWYGTDKAFQHKLTVFPESGGFKYVSNELVYNENNIIPEAKLSEMLNVERAKSVY